MNQVSQSVSEFRRPLLEMLAHLKNIDVDVFDDVLQNAKHWANDASNDVNRPPLVSSDLMQLIFSLIILPQTRMSLKRKKCFLRPRAPVLFTSKPSASRLLPSFTIVTPEDPKMF